MSSYVGRLAPSPTGLLHLGHASTFWTAYKRARDAGGRLFLRNDDLDRERCRDEFVEAMREDMRWLGIEWEEPMLSQSERLELYKEAARRLHAGGFIYPCRRSRKDVAEASSAPHESGMGDEPLYPKAFRPLAGSPIPAFDEAGDCNWRFRVPDGQEISFSDKRMGTLRAVAGKDFGDFLIWRKDQIPSYQLACAVDDALMGISEVVRGEDLIMSTFRQKLLLLAMEQNVPDYYHCPLLNDEDGRRLSKRNGPRGLRMLKQAGVTANDLRKCFDKH